MVEKVDGLRTFDWTPRGRKLPIDTEVMLRQTKIVADFEGSLGADVESRIRRRNKELRGSKKKALRLAGDELPWRQALTDPITRGANLPTCAALPPPKAWEGRHGRLAAFRPVERRDFDLRSSRVSDPKGGAVRVFLPGGPEPKNHRSSHAGMKVTPTPGAHHAR